MGQVRSLSGKLLSELLTVRGKTHPFRLGPAGMAREGVGCDLPLLEAYLAHPLAMLGGSRAVQECVCCPPHFTVEDRPYTCLLYLNVAGAHSRFFSGFTRGLSQRPPVRVLRESFGATQCLHVLACVSVCWVCVLRITARASSKTQTSPWKTVSHLWSFLYCSQILCGSSLILHIWSWGSVLGSSHY